MSDIHSSRNDGVMPSMSDIHFASERSPRGQEIGDVTRMSRPRLKGEDSQAGPPKI